MEDRGAAAGGSDDAPTDACNLIMLCRHYAALTSAACAASQDRWAAASGFDDAPVDSDVAREVVMLCCAIKPLCAWNGQVRV